MGSLVPLPNIKPSRHLLSGFIKHQAPTLVKKCLQQSSNSHYGRFDRRRAVLGLTASLRLLTGYLTGWNSKTTHVYAPPYGFTPPTPPKRQQFSFWGRCRINAAFRQVWERRIYAAARRQSENSRSESQNENCWR